MKKLLVLVGLVVIALVVYRMVQAGKAPVATFEEFANALARGRTDVAVQWTAGELPNLAKGERYRWAGNMPVELIHGVSYTVESKSSVGSNEFELVVKQRVRFDPPGVHSAVGGASWAAFRLSGRIRKMAGVWKVVGFDSEFIESGDTR